MMPVFEDQFTDVLGKAMRGLGLGKQALASACGLTRDNVNALLGGHADPELLKMVAGPLDLCPTALLAIAQNAISPPEVESVDGLRMFTTPFPVPGYQEMTVNSYLVADRNAGVAIAFDTGSSVASMLEDVRRDRLELKMVFLTHTHVDHIAALPELLAACDAATVIVSRKEPYQGARLLDHGERLTLGGLEVEARLTSGHSPGGMTYRIKGLSESVAIVGDAIFCLSQGGVPGDEYADALSANMNEILGMSEDTILCPGHGPMTTVAFERRHNPFFAHRC